jgi:hypothetical protein
MQAVHPRKGNIIDYFRHKGKSKCMASIQSMAHYLAKFVFEGKTTLLVNRNERFFYDSSRVEIQLHDGRPDVVLYNSVSGEHLIVEIYYSHHVKEKTLRGYLEKGEKVLEIDISSTREFFPPLFEFERLVLEDAPRDFLELPEPDYAYKVGTGNWNPVKWLKGDWWLVVCGVLLILLGYGLYRAIFPKPAIAKRGRR